jgi:uncharacterized protein (DUF1697 family)
MSRYVALLRGINVGGNNLIKMTALKQCLEQSGLRRVSTYIASGNVLFEADDKAPVLVAKIEKLLGATFRYEASIVLRSRKQLRDTVAGAPPGFGGQPAKYRYDVIFLKEPLKAAAALAAVMKVITREGVDQIWPGPSALYSARLIARATQSQISRVVGLPVYQSMTIRNWNTTTKLAHLMEAEAEKDS